MLIELNDIRAQVTELKQKADKYASWQDTFDLPMSSVSGINQTITKLSKTEVMLCLFVAHLTPQRCSGQLQICATRCLKRTIAHLSLR